MCGGLNYTDDFSFILNKMLTNFKNKKGFQGKMWSVIRKMIWVGNENYLTYNMGTENKIEKSMREKSGGIKLTFYYA